MPHKNFTFLDQGSYEIAGKGLARPPLVSEGLRIKKIIMIRAEKIFRQEKDHLTFTVLISQS